MRRNTNVLLARAHAALTHHGTHGHHANLISARTRAQHAAQMLTTGDTQPITTQKLLRSRPVTRTVTFVRCSDLWICPRFLQRRIAAGAVAAQLQLFPSIDGQVDQVDESPIGTCALYERPHQRCRQAWRSPMPDVLHHVHLARLHTTAHASTLWDRPMPAQARSCAVYENSRSSHNVPQLTDAHASLTAPQLVEKYAMRG